MYALRTEHIIYNAQPNVELFCILVVLKYLNELFCREF